MKFYLSFLFVFFASFLEADNWWIFFNDKSCSKEIKLAEKSIERRLKQNILFDDYDLPVCLDYVNILKEHDLIIRHHSRWFNAVSVSLSSLDILDSLLVYDFIKDIRPVVKIEIKKDTLLTNKTLDYSHYSRISNILEYGPSFNQINMLGGVDLHNLGFFGSDMTIAVFDAGFFGVQTLPIFQSLWDNNQIIDMYDFVDNDNDVFGGSTHGTMVLSTMAGDMADSLIGVAPEANYMLFRTEDSASETLIEEDNWAAAAEYADSVGVHIINSSLGYTILYDDTLNSHSYTDMDGNSTIITVAADLAASKGILVVNSAGNSGNNDWYYIGAPADGDSVLAIGAVNNAGEIASFSSRGPSYDGRVKPNVCAQGVNTIVADMDSTIRVANGTSFSSPLIAGLSACLWGALESNSINLTSMEVFKLIEQSSHLFQNPNDSLGHGIPNFHEAYLNGLDMISNENYLNLELFPNPVENKLIIYNDNALECNIDIFNVMGSCILSTTINQVHNIIDLSHCQPGIYFVKVREEVCVYSIVKI